MERSGRRRRIQPNLDAEQHIKLKTDKAGLKEHFINPYKGRGVFATEVFKKGDFVLEYRGKLLKQEPSHHTKKYCNTEEVFLFDFQWKENSWCLDASEEDNSLGRLVNDDHQNPNCKMKVIAVEGMPHLCLFALKDIEPGEEITYSYGDGAWPWRKKKSATNVREKDDVTTQKSATNVREKDDVTTQKSATNVREEDDVTTQKSGLEVGKEDDVTTQKSASDVREGGDVTTQKSGLEVRKDDDVTTQKSATDVREEDDVTTQKSGLEVRKDDDVTTQKSATNVREEDDVTTQKSGLEVGKEDDVTTQKSASDVREGGDVTTKKSATDVREEDDVTTQKSATNVREEDDVTTQKSATNVREKDDVTTQSRMTKLRRHHEECITRHKIAEEQQNSKEKQQTKILMQRAKLVKKLAELDKHLNSPPDDATEGPSWSENTQARVPLATAILSSTHESHESQSLASSQTRPLRQRQATTFMETNDESDYTDYSDMDYVPDSEDKSSSETDEDTQLKLVEKQPLRSMRYPCLDQSSTSDSPTKRNRDDSTAKTYSGMSQKRKMSSSNSPKKGSTSTPKKSRVEQICDSIKVLPPSNSGTRRVYNKRNYCLFCLRPTSKIARHLETVHGDVEEVALAIQHPKHSKERRNKLNILRARGNFAYNASVVKKGAGELQACYRPRKSSLASDFIHCFYCQGLYAKRTLWKHMKRCPAKNEPDDDSGNGKRRIRSKCALKTAVARDVSEGLSNVISCMKYDQVTQIIQNDQLLLQFGQHLFDLNGSRKNRHDYIRQRLRELGRLLLVAKKNTPIQKAQELIYPANFNHMVSAVKQLAGYNPEQNTFCKPTLALKIGNSLGVISELVESDNLSSVDRDWSLVNYAREFKTIKNFRWKGLITRGATTTMKESKWNAPQILPLTEDVKCLDSHLENVKVTSERMLRVMPSASSYATLAKVILAQVIIFNRRREGEVSRMELSTFKTRRSDVSEDMAACLTPLENKMCSFFTRVEIRGKRGRGVPVLLKPSMLSAMELLVDNREMCGVPKENIYMFARPGALSAYRGGDCIQKFARESGAKHPEILTSTKLRKHIATMSQVLNLQENEADQLADFLGHDIRVHRQYYRLPQGTLQLAKMSKVLLAMEKGTLSQFKGQTLEEIEIDPEEKVDLQDVDSSSDEQESVHVAEEDGEGTEQSNLVSDGDGYDSPETTSSTPTPSTSGLLKHGNKSNPKRKWEVTEVRAVERHMMKFIHTCKVPQKMDCVRCINAEPYALKDRNWTGVKNYVRNRITALKRKSCAKN